MTTPKEMDVVRRAYELWQQAGEPSGKDDEFYHQAKKELQEALERESRSAVGPLRHLAREQVLVAVRRWLVNEALPTQQPLWLHVKRMT